MNHRAKHVADSRRRPVKPSFRDGLPYGWWRGHGVLLTAAAVLALWAWALIYLWGTP